MMMKCKACRKALDSAHLIPTGGSFAVYCEKCYRDIIGEISLQEEKETHKATNILPAVFQDLRRKEATLTPINAVKVGTTAAIIGIIDSDIQHKEIIKEDKSHSFKMSFCELKDDTGKLILILWNELADKAQSGKAYRVEGYIQEVGGQKQINLAYKGKIEDFSI